MADGTGTDYEDASTWAGLGEIVAAILSDDPVCDACLGRVVADRSFGLTNHQRGEALRTTAALVNDTPYVSPNPADCWVCEGHSEAVDRWADRVVGTLTGLEFRSYQIGCRMPPLLEENDRLLRNLAGLETDAGEPLKRELNREVGKRVGERTYAEVDFDRPDVLALLEVERGTVELMINPAFVYGRYRKLERDIPQTEWPCSDCGGGGRELGPDGERECQGCDGSGYRYDRSVEQLTAPHVVEAMDGSEGVFHGAGREDVDARMVGTGRPFVIEVKEPRRRFPEISALEQRINDANQGIVEVTDLSLGSYELVERVKELPATKTYRLEVEFETPIETEDLDAAVDQLRGITVEQQTPERVTHRRADRLRTREVYEISAERINPLSARIEVRGEGGLYVKELMHGDGGRTIPSLSEALEVPVTVRSLDVLAVTATDEPFAPPKTLIAREDS